MLITLTRPLHHGCFERRFLSGTVSEEGFEFPTCLSGKTLNTSNEHVRHKRRQKLAEYNFQGLAGNKTRTDSAGTFSHTARAHKEEHSHNTRAEELATRC